MKDLKWTLDDCQFPNPPLVEGRVYAVKSSCGIEFEATFNFGDGEYWWTCPIDKKEVKVKYFCRGK